MSNFASIKNIAYLGPQNSFSEIAKDEYCKLNNIQCFSTPLKTIKEVVDYVAKSPDTVGILPVENNLDGTIRESLDCLIALENQNITIIEELIIPIEYCLLSKTTEFYSITGLISTPRLLGKCQDFIENELPRNLNIIETPTMLEAAQELNNHNLTFASIGNRKIAENCRLNILKENIHNDKNNITRYIVIGDSETIQKNPELNDTTVVEYSEYKTKSTIAFRTNNTPGALLEILKVFLENNLNLSYISSRPSKICPNEYIFIVNIDDEIKNKNIENIVSEVRPKTSFFRYLGSYATSDLSKPTSM